MKNHVLIQGRVWVFGDNVNTDSIIPGRFVYSTDWESICKHLFEGLDQSLASKIQDGDIIVGGRNFGCGSARPAPYAMKRAGIACAVAKSFSRVFLRNAIDSGFPILECDLTDKVISGEEIKVDFSTSTVTLLASGEELKGQPLPKFMLDILQAGGVIPYTRKKLEFEERSQ